MIFAVFQLVMVHIALTHCYKLGSFLIIIFAVFVQTAISASKYCNFSSLLVYWIHGSLVVPCYIEFFCYSCQIFVTIVMRWSDKFTKLRPTSPVWCQNLGPILNASWDMVNFVWKFTNFHYHVIRVILTQISLST